METRFLKTLGRCCIEANGAEIDLAPGKPFALLAYLAIEDRPVRREEVARLLWPAASRRRALQSLRQAIWQLRQRFGGNWLAGADPLELSAGFIETDLARLGDLILQGRVSEAADLWHGPFLSVIDVSGGRAWQDWVDHVGRRVEKVLADALHNAAGDGPAAQAVGLLEAAFSVQPYVPRHGLALATLLLDQQEVERAIGVLEELRRAVDLAESVADIRMLEERAHDMLRKKKTPPNGSIGQPPFVGRVPELSELARSWRLARGGTTKRLLIDGPAGIGRTRLCEELVSTVRSDGGRIVRVVATASESGMDLGAVATLADQLNKMPGAPGVTSASEAVLNSLFPSKTRDGTPVGVHTPAYADALMDLVSAVAFERPILIVLEDICLMDRLSLGVLSRVLRELEREPVLFVLTVSSDRMRADLQRAVEDIRTHSIIDTIVLSPLTEEETRQWIAGTIEGPTDYSVNSFATQLHAAAGGNPGRAMAGLRELSRLGSIQAVGSKWRLVPGRLPAVLPVPSDDATSNRSRRRFWVAAAAVVLTLSAGILGVQVITGGEPAWGGGQVWWVTGDSVRVLQPPHRSAGRWRVLPAPVNVEPGAALVGPFISTESDTAFYVQHYELDTSPWLARLERDGSESQVARGETDINAPSLSPDGRRLAYLMDDPGTAEAYDIGVVLAEPDGGSPVTVFQTLGKMAFFGWSPDGSWLLASRIGRPDSLLVIDPAGNLIHALGWERIHSAAWCGSEDVAFLTDQGNEPARMWKPSSGVVRDLSFYPLPGGLACSPDGAALIAFVANGSSTRLGLHEIESGGNRILWDEPAGSGFLRWAARPAAVIDRVQIAPTSSVLEIGEQRRLQASVLGTDRRIRADPITWFSSNRQIASVDSRGVLWGNGPGSVKIIAKAGVWRADTLDVQVTSRAREGSVLMRNPLTSLDSTFWIEVGEEPSEIVVSGERRVLSLKGDGQHRDGLISRDSLDLSYGATAEIHFRMPLTRRDRQQLILAFIKPRWSADSTAFDFGVAEGYVSVHYPADELDRFDEQAVGFNIGGYGFTGLVPSSFESAVWNQLTLQIQPDGVVGIWVNGEYANAGQLSIDKRIPSGWRLAILGASVDTELLVRDLIVWRGARYDVPGG